MLIAPLLLFVVVTFVVPILSMLFRSVENDIVPDTIPGVVTELAEWFNRGAAVRTSFPLPLSGPVQGIRSQTAHQIRDAPEL